MWYSHFCGYNSQEISHQWRIVRDSLPIWQIFSAEKIHTNFNSIYYEMWYFLCVTNTKLFILIHTKDKKMKKATNHVWSIEQTNHAPLKVCFSSWWIFLLYIFKLLTSKSYLFRSKCVVYTTPLLQINTWQFHRWKGSDHWENDPSFTVSPSRWYEIEYSI